MTQTDPLGLSDLEFKIRVKSLKETFFIYLKVPIVREALNKLDSFYKKGELFMLFDQGEIQTYISITEYDLDLKVTQFCTYQPQDILFLTHEERLRMFTTKTCGNNEISDFLTADTDFFKDQTGIMYINEEYEPILLSLDASLKKGFKIFSNDELRTLDFIGNKNILSRAFYHKLYTEDISTDLLLRVGNMCWQKEKFYYLHENASYCLLKKEEDVLTILNLSHFTDIPDWAGLFLRIFSLNFTINLKYIHLEKFIQNRMNYKKFNLV